MRAARNGKLDHCFTLVKTDTKVEKINNEWVVAKKASTLTISEIDEMIREQRQKIVEALDVACQQVREYNTILAKNGVQKNPEDYKLRNEKPIEHYEKIENTFHSKITAEKIGSDIELQKLKIIQKEDQQKQKRDLQKSIEETKIREEDDFLLHHDLQRQNARPGEIIKRLAKKKGNLIWEKEYNFYKKNYPDYPEWEEHEEKTAISQ